MRDSFRIERDTMGDMQVPASALYGPQTARAVHNFPISGKRFPRSFIRALGIIKSAAATMNGRMGHLPAALAASIEAAAEQIVEGRYDDEFPIDIFQTGSGTSTNMKKLAAGQKPPQFYVDLKTAPYQTPQGQPFDLVRVWGRGGTTNIWGRV